MSATTANPSSVSRPRRVLAWLLAALVLALAVLTASPSLHERLHGGHSAAAHDDAGCAVTLFGHGVTTPLALPQIVAPDIRWHTATFQRYSAPLLTAKPGLLPPGRGPPRAG